jgi:hypothetical protein
MTSDEQALAAVMVLAERLVQRVQTHPVSTLAGAAGVGVVLARGVPKIVLRMGATVALRAVAAKLIDEIAHRDAPVVPARPSSEVSSSDAAAE